MRFVIQRVLNASVSIIETSEKNTTSERISGFIGKGFLVLCGIEEKDTQEIADKMIKKLLGLRIFEDENGKTNLDLKSVNGELLIVSQFTLCADCSHGNRPSFINAAKPEIAIPLYEYIVEECRKAGFMTETGEFGADMRVDLTNDGPFTIVLDSEDLKTTSEESGNKIMEHLSKETAADVLKTCFKLQGADDFGEAINEVIVDIRRICDAKHVCLLLVDKVNRKCSMLAHSFMDDVIEDPIVWHEDEQFKLVESWKEIVPDNKTLIIKNVAELQKINAKNPAWYKSLTKARVYNLVLCPLSFDGELIGYIWATNFEVDHTDRIKDILELTTFFLSSEISRFRLLNRLHMLSTVDLLTGAFNRNAMNSRIDSMANDKDGDKHPLGVIFADLNGLKRVNDTRGHEAGDILLKNAALLLQGVFVGYEIYRAGGDEFFILLKDVSKEEVDKKVSELREAIAANKTISFAIGHTHVSSVRDVERAFHEADESMYADKRKFYMEHKELDQRRG